MFSRIAATQSLSDVARERGVAASQISRGLRRIEAECGLRLAHRTTHGLSLTDDGEIFLEYAQRILAEQQQLNDHFGRRSQTVYGMVHIGASQLLAEHVLIPRLGALRAQHPDLAVALHIDDRIASMADEGLDIAVRAGVAPAESLVARLLGEHGRALYAAPAYLRKHASPRTPADLDSHTLITNIAVPSYNRWDFVVRGVAGSREIQGQLQVNSSASVLSLALAGAGIARINDVLGARLVALGLLKPVLPRHTLPGTHQIHAVVLSARHRAPKVRAAMTFLLDSFADFRSLMHI